MKLSESVRERLDRYFDIAAFTLARPFAFGNVSGTLSDVRGPNYASVDLSLVRNGRLGERYRVQFQAEALMMYY